MSLFDWHTLSDEVWVRAVKRTLYHKKHRTMRNSAKGKNLGLLFFNSSLRTRTSMELAAHELGAHVTTLNVGQGVWGMEWQPDVKMDAGAAEHIKEAVGVLSRYYDALGVRVFAEFSDYERDKQEQRIKAVIDAATVPIVNLESAFYHPCQALGDAGTLASHFNGRTAGKTFMLTWAYHPKPLPMAVPNSALLTAARLGMNVVVARPEGYALDPDVMNVARSYAAARNASIIEVDDPDAGYENADIVYAKAWGGPMAYTDPEGEAITRAG
ncbi:MAG: N-acetylornithine carbamoyltransferase, partial [Bacteroidota bacterium]